MDVGCGNNGPYQAKMLRGDIYYIGLDVATYNQTFENLSDEYYELSPLAIIQYLRSNQEKYDAVLCAHVLEHSESRDELLKAMLGSLKVGGVLYLSFPSRRTIHFPSRAGSLNYFDDDTHQGLPPDTRIIDEILRDCGCVSIYRKIFHRPLAGVIFGLLNEFASSYKRQILRGTWALWGFETVYWIKKIK